MPKDRRLVLISVLGLALAGQFWATSRFPALNDKALMGGDTRLQAVGFETVVEVDPTDPLLVQAMYSTVNWLETNRKGITFGVLFGAVLMTVIGLLKRKSFRNRFANSALGIVLGAPLGVCVNCAAPIAQGLRSGGARAELMLSTMISSPTLNVIVLTMLFALFPLYMVVIKLGLTVAVIMVAVPLVTRFMLNEDEVAITEQEAEGEACEIPLVEAPMGWWASARWVFTNYLKSLWTVTRLTVPLMFLAGFLGAVLITFLPWDSFAEILPTGSRMARVAGVGVVAAVGLFVPVPITFDIILPAILLAAGMPVSFVMALLFTLGIFSVYSFFIVWKSMPPRVVLALTAIMLVLAVGGGLGANRHGVALEQERERLIFAQLAEGLPPSFIKHDGADTAGQDDQSLVASLTAARVNAPDVLGTSGGVSIGRLPFSAADRGSEPRFTKLEGGDIGLDAPYSYSVMAIMDVTTFRSVAVGDVHNDGWQDVLVSSESGAALFANQGGGSFIRQALGVGGLQDLLVVNAALVDLDDDGWLDLYLASYTDGNWIVYNREGVFSGSPLVRLPNRAGAVISPAASFGDPDRDDDLDIAIGNWSYDGIRGVPQTNPESQNVLLRNGSAGFDVEGLPGAPGATYSALFTDFTGDGLPDLAMSNDHGVPDHFYLGDGGGGLRLIKRADEIIPYTGRQSMGFHTADIDNDLRPEMYISNVSGRGGDTELRLQAQGEMDCDDFTSPLAVSKCHDIATVHTLINTSRRRRDLTVCEEVGETFQDDCLAVHLVDIAFRRGDPSLCNSYPDGWERLADICRRSAASKHSGKFGGAQPGPDLPPVIMGTNVLLTPSDDGPMVDRAKHFGIEVGGWTWNAKFADLDDNGLQDLFVANGTLASSLREPNLLYLQESPGTFTDRTAALGVGSFMPAGGYAYIDIENAGDVDIVLAPAVGPLLVYRNDLSRGNAIDFELRDHVGNRFGIGSTVIIRYGRDGQQQQMRELQSGGGHLSFDSPVLHFGLGDVDQVNRVEVLWSTGERTALEGPFAAGARYVLTRTATGTVENATSASQ